MLMKQMGTLPKEERPAFGQAVNAARKAVEELLAQAMEKISKEESAESWRRSVWILRCPAESRRLALFIR